MFSDADTALEPVISWYLARNYDYLWLTAMLEKCASAPAGSTLITGSSHALNGICESRWTNAVNCSMHSQDIYYDFQCAKRAISSAEPGHFERCFIIMGYYIAFQDLSRSAAMREWIITDVYYPVFHDARHWDRPKEKNRWAGQENIPAEIRQYCENAAKRKLEAFSTYYSPIRSRKPYFDLKGRSWEEISEEERRALGQFRAQSHNKSFQYKESFEENKKIYQEFIRFLYEGDVLPVVVIAPFTSAYNRWVLPEMKESVLELVDSAPEDVHYVDFNQSDIFECSDFVDTDHLSESGAEKMSRILADLFGN